MKELYNQIFCYVPENEQEENDKRIMLTYLSLFSNALTRENEMFHVTTSAWIVNPERTKVLMIYHNIYNSWSWVGGHADGNANLREVIQKEIAEETGVTKMKFLSKDIFGLSIQTVKAHWKNGKYVSAHLHYDLQFLVEVSEKEEIRMKPDENKGVGWLEIDTLLDKVEEEHMKPIYEKLMKKVKRLKI